MLVNKELPPYDKKMYLNGYEPFEILQACRNTMRDELLSAKDADDEGDELTVKTIVEVRK